MEITTQGKIILTPQDIVRLLADNGTISEQAKKTATVYLVDRKSSVNQAMYATTHNIGIEFRETVNK